MKATTNKATEMTTPTDEQIDDYIAREYLAQTRGQDSGSFTSRLLAMAEEARVVDPKGKMILLDAARQIAAWELTQA